MMMVNVVSNWNMPLDTLYRMNLHEYYLIFSGKVWLQPDDSEDLNTDAPTAPRRREINSIAALAKLRRNQDPRLITGE